MEKDLLLKLKLKNIQGLRIKQSDEVKAIISPKKSHGSRSPSKSVSPK
jgi:hypothetical protein